MFGDPTTVGRGFDESRRPSRYLRSRQQRLKVVTTKERSSADLDRRELAGADQFIELCAPEAVCGDSVINRVGNLLNHLSLRVNETRFALKCGDYHALKGLSSWQIGVYR